jgi:hypothetical protein
MPTEIIESKEIYRGFIALRLANAAARGRCTGEPRDHRARRGRGGSSQ